MRESDHTLDMLFDHLRLTDDSREIRQSIGALVSASNTDHIWQYRYFGILKNQYWYTGINSGIITNVM